MTTEIAQLGDRVRKGMWELAQIDFDDVEPSVKVPDGYEALAELENLLAAAEEATSILNDVGCPGDLLTALRAYIEAYAADAARLATAERERDEFWWGHYKWERDKERAIAAERERDEAIHAYQALDGVREQLAREMERVKALTEVYEAAADYTWADNNANGAYVLAAAERLRAALAACPPPEEEK